MMKNRKRQQIVAIIVSLISILYLCRYVQLNSTYHKLQTGFDEIYYMGEEVYLEENYIDISLTSKGARPMEGSSKSNNFGRLIKARPIASICCSPPERVPAI